jgi:N,N'-diacetyllegionaminate synthase
MTSSSPTISIDGRPIGAGHPCFVIAEIGVNHNGDADLAMRMIDAVADAGADCVKFQTFAAEEFCSRDEVYEYMSGGKLVRESMLEMFRRLELRRDEFARLFAHARARNLIPLSTPADIAAVDLLDTLGVGAFKVGSDDLVHTPLIRHVAAKRKPVIISTGMAEAGDIERAVGAIKATGNEQIAILHCVSLYPTPPARVNLPRITALQKRFGLPIGFSDHSFGITAAIAAVVLGVCIVEKHFTLDRDMPGPDHRFSADPAELAALVRGIREAELELDENALDLSDEERRMAELCHRSIVAARDIAPGEVLTESCLGFRRPGTGIKPYDLELVVGRRVRRPIEGGSAIDFSMLEQGA